jgi:peptide-methionine (S)-S-oxide reductase
MAIASRGFGVKTRILGTSLGLVLLVTAVVDALGQESTSPSTSSSKIQSRKPAGTKATRKKSTAGARAATESVPDASSQANGTSDGLNNGPAAATNSGDSATSGKTTADPFRSPSELEKPKTEVATFGAGCFWHVEAEFEWLPGVKSAVSGYSGGSLPNPAYEDVHEGTTGHAEVVRVEYDPSVISYEKLLRVFWKGHDPTQLNRQGPDYGTQYRSVIFYHSPEQKQAALKSYQELTRARAFRAPIVTQLMPMEAFFPAEEYHQNYYGGRDGRRPPTRKSKRTRKPATTAATAKQKTSTTGSLENTRQKAIEKDTETTGPAERAAESDPGSKPGNE